MTTTGEAPPNQTAPSPQRDWLASLAQLAVIASITVYGSGFVASVPHYLRRTVPIRALTHDVYIGAGALFWLITGLGLAIGLSVRRGVDAVREEQDASPRHMFVVAWRLVFALAPVVSGLVIFIAVGWRMYAYVAYTVLLGFLADKGNYNRITNPTLAHRVRFHGYNASLLVGALVGFAWWIFPHAAPAFGGGAEQFLASATVPNEAPSRSVDAWLNFSCRRFPTPASSTQPICRRFYRVYETHDSIYLGIAEWPGLCDDKKTARFDDTDRRCIQRISNSILPQFEVEEGRRDLMDLRAPAPK